MSDSKWALIANPVSGGGRARRIAEQSVQTLQTLGIDVDLVWTSGRGDATHCAQRAIERGARQIAACGGDGTVHEVMNGLAGSNAVLGIVPCGRGNDLARALGLPKRVDHAVAVLAGGRDRSIDLGRIGDRFYGTVASLGFDTEVARTVYENEVPFSGRLAYVVGVLKCLISYRCPHVRLTGDFGEIDGRIFLAATGNAPFYGSGIQIVPSAEIDSGALDVCIVREAARRTVLRLFARAFFGRHIHHDLVQVVRTKTLEISSDESLWIFADGEPVCQTPTTIAVAPNALKVRVPR